MSDTILELYHKHAPRWLKVIRWREWGVRVIEHQKYCTKMVYGPLVLIYFYINEDPLPQALYFAKPKTEEELMALKRNYAENVFQRNWEMGQYLYEQPPVYDLSERRKKYPQYYEGRYDGFKRYGV